MLLIYFITGIVGGMVFKATKTWTRLAVWAGCMAVFLITIDKFIGGI